MTKIATRNIVPGMVVNEDVEDMNGRVLLPKGAVIEEHHLRIFKMWGIFEVDMVEDQSLMAQSQDVEITRERLKEVMKEVNPRYVKSNLDNPCVKEIFKQDALLQARSLNEKSIKDNGLNLPEKESEEIDYEAGFKEIISIDDIINEDLELFTLPDIFAKLTSTINDPRSSARDISQIVENDSALSARTLKIVNSSFYGFSEKIETIYKAVSILGTKQLSQVAMGLSVVKIFNEIPSVYLDMDKFWKHCLGVGLCSKLIAKHLDTQEADRIFVAGIIHDIGRLVMFKKIPKQSAMAIRNTWENNEFLSDSEKLMMGFTHSELGGRICKVWNLSSFFTDIVSNHHNPEKSKYPRECSIIHLAEVIVNALEIGTSGEKMVLYLSEFAWAELNMSENIIPIIIKQLNTEIETTLGLIS